MWEVNRAAGNTFLDWKTKVRTSLGSIFHINYYIFHMRIVNLWEFYYEYIILSST